LKNKNDEYMARFDELMWSKYKPVYNGFWLTKYAEKLEKYR